MMSQNSTRHATGNLAIRVVIWLLAVVAAAGAVLSIDKVLRNRSGDEDPGAAAVILPPPPGGDDRNAGKSVESASETLAAVTGAVGVGNGATSDSAKRDDAGHSDGTPAFDIARVEPSGDTVIAGRAAPGATIELLRNGKVHDRVVADASGQFVMVPPRLPTGDSELTLRSKPRDGALAVSKQTVVVSVQPNLKDQPVVALMTPDKPSVVLSKPTAPDAPAGSVVVEAVDAEARGGKLHVTGRSVPGALVRLYLNDSYHSTATADSSGRVAFTAVGEGVERSGNFRVRLDEVDRASGVVKSRAEVPFTAPSQRVATAAAPGSAEAAVSNGGVSGPHVQKGQTMMVSRGDSLWRISRAAYGDGARYTVIYDANHNQIRNPNRIYPGQVFMIPGSKTRSGQ